MEDLRAAAAEFRAARAAVVEAKDQLKAARKRSREARERLAAAIVAEGRGGTPVQRIADETPFTREAVRLRLRQAGVEPN